MLKVFGAVMTIAGVLGSLFTLFLVLNSNVVQPYNKRFETILEVGYLIPMILFLMLLVAGLIFVASPETQDRME